MIWKKNSLSWWEWIVRYLLSYEHYDHYVLPMRKAGSSVPTFHKPLSDFKGLRAVIARIAYPLLKRTPVLFLSHCVRMRILRKLSTYTIQACHYITDRLKWILYADTYKRHLCQTIKCNSELVWYERSYGLQEAYLSDNDKYNDLYSYLTPTLPYNNVFEVVKHWREYTLLMPSFIS